MRDAQKIFRSAEAARLARMDKPRPTEYVVRQLGPNSYELSHLPGQRLTTLGG